MTNKIQSKICQKTLNGFAFNASGINNEVLTQLQKVHDSDSAVVMLKSCTLKPRKGNLPPKYLVKSNLIPGCTFNSMGLPNKGIQQNLEYIKKLKEEGEKPVFVSIAGVENPLEEKISYRNRPQPHQRPQQQEHDQDQTAKTKSPLLIRPLPLRRLKR